MSTPTRHCVYTGMYPMHHGGYANHSSVNADVKSLPTYLGNLGYRVGLPGNGILGFG
ncbi:sulfatase-like hydrolase/transferase [Bacteroides ovatus]|nr:sulfatase-like hydrolase/transferase [Bacteroides ovatus]